MWLSKPEWCLYSVKHIITIIVTTLIVTRALPKECGASFEEWYGVMFWMCALETYWRVSACRKGKNPVHANTKTTMLVIWTWQWCGTLLLPHVCALSVHSTEAIRKTAAYSVVCDAFLWFVCVQGLDRIELAVFEALYKCVLWYSRTFGPFCRYCACENCSKHDTLMTVSDFTEDTVCSICIKKLKHDDIVVKLSCGHHFHKEEIVKWLSTNISCPNCRQVPLV